MLPLLSSLKGLIKSQSQVIDNQVFRTHYKLTAVVLAVFSLMVTYNQFFGHPIACTNDGSQNAPKDIVELFCWTHYTFSVKEAFDTETGSREIVYPGISQESEYGQKVYHKYYQWVCFVLAFQALSFYLPRYLWKSMENGTVKSLILGLDEPIAEPEDIKRKHTSLLRYLKSHRGRHGWYIRRYVFCECLNFFNILGQIYLTDIFLSGEFLFYGVRVFKYLWEDSDRAVDPMITVFPRMTICKFSHYGPTGKPVHRDVFCILPLNILNEKIYIFLWFWFLLLAVVTFSALFYRLATLTAAKLRLRLLLTRYPTLKLSDAKSIILNFSVGDWFLLYQLSKNVDSIYMTEFWDRLVAQLNVKNVFSLNFEPSSFEVEEAEM